jgi:hypothetical protein
MRAMSRPREVRTMCTISMEVGVLVFLNRKVNPRVVQGGTDGV